ncbi:MAG: hypothetical protein V1492_04910 [Candidatus Micrarchaeota archaeon]
MKTVKVLLPDALGDRIMFRNVQRAALRSGVQFEVYGRKCKEFADVLVSYGTGLKVQHIKNAENGIIDLFNYSESPIHPVKNSCHLASYQVQLINKMAGTAIEFSAQDLAPTWECGDLRHLELRFNQKTIFVFGYATTRNRMLSADFWNKLTRELSSEHRIFQLITDREEKHSEYCEAIRIGTPRAVPAFIRAVENRGGYVITVDSFPLHAAGAVGSERALLLATSSNPEAVIYPGMKYIATGCLVGNERFSCGLHGYGQHVAQIKDSFGLDVQEFKEEKGGCRDDLLAAGQKYACTAAMDGKIEEIIRIVKQ